MEVIRESMSRLCQMLHDTGLRPGTEERLQVMLEAARARGLLDDSFVPLFDEALAGFLDNFTIVRKLIDDLDIRLQPTRPGSAMPATLTGLYGDNLFKHWWPCDCPASRQRMSTSRSPSPPSASPDKTIDIITHVYEQIVHKDHYVPEEDDRTVAFLDHRATLDGLVQKHVDLAGNAAPPHCRLVARHTRTRGYH